MRILWKGMYEYPLVKLTLLLIAITATNKLLQDIEQKKSEWIL